VDGISDIDINSRHSINLESALTERDTQVAAETLEGICERILSRLNKEEFSIPMKVSNGCPSRLDP
jgi:hypothetical protein